MLLHIFLFYIFGLGFGTALCLWLSTFSVYILRKKNEKFEDYASCEVFRVL
jgi:hypothetical protein